MPRLRRLLRRLCPIGSAPADPGEVHRPALEPLVNGRLVTVEVISVNDRTAVGRSLDRAVENFSRYVAGEVRMVRGTPVELQPDADGLLTLSQVDAVVSERRHDAPSDIAVVFLPALSGQRGRGYCSQTPNGSHVVVIQTNRIEKAAPPVYREQWWQLVIMHELCHALGVPCDRSHAWHEHHCTHPECVLYPHVDVRAVISAILHLGPPLDLCRACRREVRRAQETSGGDLFGPEETFDRMTWMEKLVRLNADNPRVYARRADIYYARKEYDSAARDMDRAIELAPDTAAYYGCLLYTSPSPRDATLSRMPSSA